MPTPKPTYEPDYIEDWDLFEDEALAAEAEALSLPGARACAPTVPAPSVDTSREEQERSRTPRVAESLTSLASVAQASSTAGVAAVAGAEAFEETLPTGEREQTPVATGEQLPQSVALPAMPVHDPKKSEEPGVWMPGLFSRSALFAAFPEGKHAREEKRLLATHGPYTVWLEGPRLNMIDKATYEAFVEAAWRHGFAGEEIELSLGAMARARGVSEGGPNARITVESLKRLAKAKIAFERRDAKTGAAIVQGEAFLLRDLRQLPAPEGRNPRGGAWVASFDKDLVPLFALDLRFESAPNRRAQLSTSLARWCHDYFGSHKPYRGHRLPELRALCGFAGPKSDFPALLRAALDDVVARAPRCVSSYALAKKTRDSDTWTIAVERAENPRHVRDKDELDALVRARRPAAEPPADGAARKARKTPSPRRGGVAL